MTAEDFLAAVTQVFCDTVARDFMYGPEHAGYIEVRIDALITTWVFYLGDNIPAPRITSSKNSFYAASPCVLR